MEPRIRRDRLSHRASALCAVAAAALGGCADTALPSCGDSAIRKMLTEQTREKADDPRSDVFWTPEDIQTLDWDEQTARLIGISAISRIEHLNSCAASLMPSKEQIWTPGREIDPGVIAEIEATRKSADAACKARTDGVGRTVEPDPVVCHSEQERAKQLSEYNEKVRTGHWVDLGPHKIRYVTGRYDDGRPFAKIILR